MAILKKPIKKVKEEEVPMWHKGDSVTFDDGEGNELSATILSVDNEAKNAAVKTDDGDDYEVEFSELKAVEKKAVKKVKAEPEVEDEPKTKKKTSSNGKSSLCSLLKKAEASKGGGGLPKGRYEAIVVEISINKTDKGQSGMIKYTVVNNDDQEGKTGVEFFNLVSPAGEEQQGLGYFKGALETLGFDEEGFQGNDEDLEEALNNLADKEIYVEINVVKNAEGYVHHYLNEVLDQDDKPDPLPF